MPQTRATTSLASPDAAPGAAPFDSRPGPQTRSGARSGLAASFSELHLRALANHGGQLERVPVRQPHAAVRLRVSNSARLRRAMNTVMRLADVDPHYAYRSIGSGRHFGLRVFRIRVPEQIRVVVEAWIARHGGHCPGANR